jgi:hypothetical protein
MATRYSLTKGQYQTVDSGYDSGDEVNDFTMPSCTIEDVDRGVFELFNKELPLFYKRKDQVKRVPVIFATGERFAILARNKPLRDKSNALILPLISVIRSSIDQDSAKGAGQFQGGPITVKVKLAEDDLRYQRLQNIHGFKNSDENAIDAFGTQTDGDGGGTTNGRLATRRPAPSVSVSSRRGTILTPNLRKNLVEMIQIPPIKQYTATYEITFWTQYTQEMNSMLNVLMSGYIENRRRTFVIETESGYRFSAFVDAALSPQNNFDDFTDVERLVKYNFTMSVAAYIVVAQEPGMPVPFRKTISSPDVQFGVSQNIGGMPAGPPPAGIPSGNPMDWIFAGTTPADEGNPPAGIGVPKGAGAIGGFPGTPTVEVGGQSAANLSGPARLTSPKTIITSINPFTGKKEHLEIIISSADPKTGEAVFKFSKNSPSGIAIDLGKLTKD